MFNAKGNKVPSVGVSIGLERMFIILEEQARKKNEMRSKETQVLVASVGKDMTADRLKIMG